MRESSACERAARESMRPHAREEGAWGAARAEAGRACACNLERTACGLPRKCLAAHGGACTQAHAYNTLDTHTRARTHTRAHAHTPRIDRPMHAQTQAPPNQTLGLGGSLSLRVSGGGSRLPSLETLLGAGAPALSVRVIRTQWWRSAAYSWLRRREGQDNKQFF
jgi:hypothetical protein